DLPNNRIMKWEEETGHVIVFRKPSNYANGNTQDRQGRLVTCEHDARRVTRTEHDGSVTVVLDRYGGKPLNSPHDVVVKSVDPSGSPIRPSGLPAITRETRPIPSCRRTSTESMGKPVRQALSPATCAAPTVCVSRPTRRGSM